MLWEIHAALSLLLSRHHLKTFLFHKVFDMIIFLLAAPAFDSQNAFCGCFVPFGFNFHLVVFILVMNHIGYFFKMGGQEKCDFINKY